MFSKFRFRFEWGWKRLRQIVICLRQLEFSKKGELHFYERFPVINGRLQSRVKVLPGQPQRAIQASGTRSASVLSLPLKMKVPVERFGGPAASGPILSHLPDTGTFFYFRLIIQKVFHVKNRHGNF